MIRIVKIRDAEQICNIYNHYVINSIATFEEKPVGLAEMTAYIESTIVKFPWLVCEENNEILGYAYAGSWKSRCAYKYSLESTVYVKPGYFGHGTGTRLYQELIELLNKSGYRAIIAGISLPNEASVALHEKLGFEKIGHFKEVGFKFNKWIDVGYWELLLKGIQQEHYMV